MAHRAERAGSHVRLFMARLGGIQEAEAEREAHLLRSLRESEDDAWLALYGDVLRRRGGLPASPAPADPPRHEALR